jgi:hypothetical protein
MSSTGVWTWGQRVTGQVRPAAADHHRGDQLRAAACSVAALPVLASDRSSGNGSRSGRAWHQARGAGELVGEESAIEAQRAGALIGLVLLGGEEVRQRRGQPGRAGGDGEVCVEGHSDGDPHRPGDHCQTRLGRRVGGAGRRAR